MKKSQSVFVANLGKRTPGEKALGGHWAKGREEANQIPSAAGMKERGTEEPAKGRKTGPKVQSPADTSGFSDNLVIWFLS